MLGLDARQSKGGASQKQGTSLSLNGVREKEQNETAGMQQEPAAKECPYAPISIQRLCVSPSIYA